MSEHLFDPARTSPTSLARALTAGWPRCRTRGRGSTTLTTAPSGRPRRGRGHDRVRTSGLARLRAAAGRHDGLGVAIAEGVVERPLSRGASRGDGIGRRTLWNRSPCHPLRL